MSINALLAVAVVVAMAGVLLAVILGKRRKPPAVPAREPVFQEFYPVPADNLGAGEPLLGLPDDPLPVAVPVHSEFKWQDTKFQIDWATRVEAERLAEEVVRREEAAMLAAKLAEQKRMNPELHNVEEIAWERIRPLRSTRKPPHIKKTTAAPAPVVAAAQPPDPAALARAEAARLAAAEAARQEADREAIRQAEIVREAKRKEDERIAAEDAWLESERLAAEEAERVEAERVAAARVKAAQLEAERLAALEAARVAEALQRAEHEAREEAAKLAAEEAIHARAAALLAQEAARVQAARQAALAAEQAVAERIRAEKEARQAAERALLAEAARIEAERIAAVEAKWIAAAARRNAEEEQKRLVREEAKKAAARRFAALAAAPPVERADTATGDSVGPESPEKASR